jgi:hypothetical protein
LKELKDILEKKGYIAKLFNNSKEACEELLKDIKIDETIGIGGSTTILEMGIWDILKERGHKVFWHWKSENKSEVLKLNLSTNVYLSSVNAITEDGIIVNMDGTGNRVSSTIFGHEKVFLIIGKNKICKDYKAAISRIKTIAAPKNAQRLDLDTPCKYTGKCEDCNSPQRICNVEVVLHRKPNGTNIFIYLIDENLGF